MQYRALACDYDGTLATHGVVDPDTLAALDRWQAAGRKLLMVTGRELPELRVVFPEHERFDYIVVENGGLLYVPSTGEERLVSPPPPKEFVDELVAHGVGPISVGRSIVATWQPHENTVLETIQRLGLELQVIFNKGAVMILPTGVNKATGLAAALRALELSRHSVVGVGDAENDHAFLKFCRCGVAVANALPALKQRAEIVTAGDHGRGVQELIERLLRDDLAELHRGILRHALVIHPDGGEDERHWFPGQEHLVLVGEESIATTVALDLADKLGVAGYQYCRFLCHPPERETHAQAAHSVEVNLGSDDQLPTAAEVAKDLIRPDQCVTVQMCAQGPDERRQRLDEIWQRLREFVGQRGRPHVVFLPPRSELEALGLSAAELARGLPATVAMMETVEQVEAIPEGVPYQILPVERWTSTTPVIPAT